MISIDTHRRLQSLLLWVLTIVVALSPLWATRRSGPVLWIYAALAVMLLTSLIYWRHLKRYTRNGTSRRCPLCEYELVKQTYVDLCPECGLRFEPGEREQLWDARLRMLKGEPNEYPQLLEQIRSKTKR